MLEPGLLLLLVATANFFVIAHPCHKPTFLVVNPKKILPSKTGNFNLQFYSSLQHVNIHKMSDLYPTSK
jgi:hypothetical protein